MGRRAGRRTGVEAESDARGDAVVSLLAVDRRQHHVFKTALWLHTLERSLGWPTLQRAMSSYFERWKFRHPQPADFFQAMSDAAGRDMTPFFDQVYRGSNAFDYGVQQLTSAPVGRRQVPHDGGRPPVRRGDVSSGRRHDIRGRLKEDRALGWRRTPRDVRLRHEGSRAIGGGRSEPNSAARRELHEQQSDAAAAGRGSEPQMEPQMDGVAAGHPAHVRRGLF